MENINLDELFDDESMEQNNNVNGKVMQDGNKIVDTQSGEFEEVKNVNKQMYDATKQMAKNQPAPVEKSMAMKMNERMLARIDELTKTTGESFTGRDRVIATNIIVSSYQAVKKTAYDFRDIDFLGNNYESQVKRWAKLGVDTEDYLYTELRKNGKTGKVDIKVKPQYQTLEKLIIKYCSKDIFRFKTDIICEGDEFATDFDFAKGQDVVKSHKKNESIDRNELTNIIGAYKIAYVKEKDGSVTQLLVQIDKTRIMRAYNSAQTKNVWNTDTVKMVLKTVTWEMWNSEVIRPFMVFPDDIVENDNLSIVNENADVDFENKDFKHKDIIDAEISAKKGIGTGEGLDF